MKNVLRIRASIATAIALLTLLALAGVASAEEAVVPSPLAGEMPAQCEDAAGLPALETPEPDSKLSVGCSEEGTEVYICMDNDTLCGGCSSGHCAFLAYETYQFGYYYRSCNPGVTKCTDRCTFNLPCNELCA